MDMNEISRLVGQFVREKFKIQGLATNPDDVDSKMVADGLMEYTPKATQLTRLGKFYFSNNMRRLYTVFRMEMEIQRVHLPVVLTREMSDAVMAGLCTALGPCNSEYVTAANAVAFMYLLGMPIDNPTPNEVAEMEKIDGGFEG